MKIAHVVDNMEMGGAEMLVSQLCRLQRETGNDPSIYAIANLGALGKQMLKEGIRVQPHLGRHLPDAARNLYHVFRLLRPDVVHLHNPTPTIYAAIPAKLAGIRSIVSTRHSLVAKPRNAQVEIKYAVAAACCDWIVGICDATVNNLRNLHTTSAKKLVRVYNGAAPLSRTPEAKCPSKEGFTLLYVGRLEPVKNHVLLLQAFSEAFAQSPTLRLWVVGDGTERKRLEAIAANLGISAVVTFWGQQFDISPFFSIADAFIMSSQSEGLPMSLLQALSLGLPSIVTDVGGMAEVVRMTKAGIVVPLNCQYEMTEAILRFAVDDAAREQCSKNAEVAFASNFTLQIMANAYMHLYKTTPRMLRCHS